MSKLFPRSLCRLTAQLLLLCLGLFTLEGIITDVHAEGHGSEAAVSVQAAGDMHTSASSEGHSKKSAEQHIHMCHCTHTHVAVADVSDMQQLRLVLPSDNVFPHVFVAWHSRSIPPDFRPPIA